MPQANPTIFQRLQQVLTGNRNVSNNIGNSYEIHQHSDGVVDIAHSQEEYDQKLLQHQQARFLAKQWVKTNYDVDNRSLAELNDVRLMYRDCDLMDGFPEIGASLDITTEEVCTPNEEGFLVNVFSKSERIKAILEDLFVNRLSINITLPMITRCMLKYGNDFMALNITEKNGITGWKELPVYEIERYENGMEFPYTMTAVGATSEDKLEDTRFVWVGSSQTLSYKNFQMAHFRLLYDSQLMPYGVSFLNKGRRHFRLLSMMEDCLFVYRLDRSMERRVFKINVGAIDSEDVPAYIQEVANNFKRTPIFDPKTGQLDTRKNLMNVTNDFFIPVLPGQDYNPIETLAAGQNLTAMDDIKYMQNKICSGLRVPKPFLNFEEPQGEGKNLSLLDIRFAKTVTRIQQALIMELNKVAIIHLTMLGFDDVTNFKLTMTTSSHSVEMMELENLAKKVTIAKDAISDAGNGIPLMSMNYAWKHIFHWSDKQIQQNLEEERLEAALAIELQRTPEIIKKTGVFQPVDNLYGEPGADYSDESGGPQGGPEGGHHGGGPMGGGGFMGGPPMGGDLDFGEEGMAEGAEGEMPLEDLAMPEGGGEEMPSQGIGESIDKKLNKKLITETRGKGKKNTKANAKKQQEANTTRLFEELTNRMLHLNNDKKKETANSTVPLYDKSFLINEELNSLAAELRDRISSEDTGLIE